MGLLKKDRLISLFTYFNIIQKCPQTRKKKLWKSPHSLYLIVFSYFFNHKQAANMIEEQQVEEKSEVYVWEVVALQSWHFYCLPPSVYVMFYLIALTFKINSRWLKHVPPHRLHAVLHL